MSRSPLITRLTGGRIPAVLLVGLVAFTGFVPGSASRVAAADFTVETLNSDIVYWPSLDIDAQGDAHLVNYFTKSGDYGGKYRHRHLGVWTEEIIAHTVGAYGSMALDPAGTLHVVYYDGGTPTYAHRVNGAWTAEPIDGAVGNYDSMGQLSLAFDDQGIPHVAYPRDGVLLYAVRNGGQWSRVVVDPALDINYYDPGTSLRLDSRGQPWVSYHRGARVMCAHQESGGWILEDIAGGGAASSGTSLALDAEGQPVILFADVSSGQLQLATKQGDRWSIESPDGGSQAASYGMSLVIDRLGNPHLSYRDGGTLRYATRGADGVWTQTDVASSANSGVYTALALSPAGFVEIAFKFKAPYSGAGALRYATRPLASSGVPEAGGPSALLLRVSGAGSSSDGRLALSFRLPGNDPVRFDLFDVSGRQVATRPPEMLSAGPHEMTWETGARASGVYFVRMSVSDGRSVSDRWLNVRR